MSDLRFLHASVVALGLALAAGLSAASAAPVYGPDKAWWDTGQGVRPPIYKGVTRTSVYVPMRDGTRLAIDTYLPRGLRVGQTVPAVLVQTRYLRSVQYQPQYGGACHFADSSLEAAMQYMVTRGYAAVIVDVRGTGASYGFRMTELSPAEVADGNDVVNWIVSQPWSNRIVGSTGISYLGYTAELLTSNQNPYVKASMPMFNGFDIYKELAFSGGIENRGFDIPWSIGNEILDIGGVAPSVPPYTFLNPKWLQPCPVDADPQGVMLAKARHQHLRSTNIVAAFGKINFRDDRVHGFTVDDSSPFTYRYLIDGSPSALYFLASQDDSGYSSGQINRLINAAAGRMRLTLGPWSHGGAYYYEPGVHGVVHSSFDQLGEILRYFDYYLMGLDDLKFSKQPLIHYFTTGIDQWQTANSWPPKPIESLRLQFGPNNTLVPEAASQLPGSDTYAVNFNTNSGKHARWNTTLGGYPVFYPNRATIDQQLLTYTSAPLKSSLEVTGETYVTVYVNSNQPDFELFAYLEDVTPQGEVNYVTEGDYRASHSSPGELPYFALSPSHSDLKGDRLPPLGANQILPMTITLIADSHVFFSGHSIRIALAGADADYFSFLSLPPATLAVFRGGDDASTVTLPTVHFKGT